ncbi:MAG: DNA methyltransferase [Gammaproteobacteria bacterium]|nr:DNA methyltransferase [Gammaproteobacteria bacterium]
MKKPEYISGELWTAKQRQGHSIHEISYRACFKPQLPNYFITRFSGRGDTVLDPFMGRGTTPIEASLMGRKVIGSDVNPLSLMLTRPRLNPPKPGMVARRLDEIPLDGAVDAAAEKLLVFYHPRVLQKIVSIKEWIQRREKDKACDEVDDWIRMVCINRMSGHSPGFFSVRTMPPNQAVSVEAQEKINRKNNRRPQDKDVKEIILRKTLSLLRSPMPEMKQKTQFKCASARDLGWIADESVDLTVTSPPFMNVVDYAKDNWLRCWFANIDPAKIPFDHHGKKENWGKFVRKALREIQRVTVAGGTVAFEVGEIQGGKTMLEEDVMNAAAGLPLRVEKIYINRQRFTKTANCWNVSNNTRGTNTNRVVLMRKLPGEAVL